MQSINNTIQYNTINFLIHIIINFVPSVFRPNDTMGTSTHSINHEALR